MVHLWSERGERTYRIRTVDAGEEMMSGKGAEIFRPKPADVVGLDRRVFPVRLGAEVGGVVVLGASQSPVRG